MTDWNDRLRDNPDFTVYDFQQYVQDVPLPEPEPFGPRWEPDHEQPERTFGTDHEAHEERLSYTDSADFHGLPIPEREWIVDQWGPVGHVVGFYGASTTGKSLLAQMLLTSAAIDRPWLGISVKQVRAVGIFCEDEEECRPAAQNLQHAQRAGRGSD